MVKAIAHPESRIEKIVRSRVAASTYWAQYCYGLNAATLVSRAVGLDVAGGLYSTAQKPTPFLCLLVKLCQLAPDIELIQEYLDQTAFPEMKCLGAAYIRIAAPPVHMVDVLLPLLDDYTPVRYVENNEYSMITVDQFVDRLLTDTACCDIVMPQLPKQLHLEERLATRPSDLATRLGVDRVIQEEGFLRTPSSTEQVIVDVPSIGNSRIDAINRERAFLGLRPLHAK
jgi:pre-mRNA-splicing factor 38A